MQSIYLLFFPLWETRLHGRKPEQTYDTRVLPTCQRGRDTLIATVPRRRQCTWCSVSIDGYQADQRCKNILIEHQIPRRLCSLVVSKPLRHIRQGDALQLLMDELPIRPSLRRCTSHAKRRNCAMLLRFLLRSGV